MQSNKYVGLYKKMENMYIYYGKYAARKCSASTVKNLMRLVPTFASIEEKVSQERLLYPTILWHLLKGKVIIQKLRGFSYGSNGLYTYIYLNLIYC